MKTISSSNRRKFRYALGIVVLTEAFFCAMLATNANRGVGSATKQIQELDSAWLKKISVAAKSKKAREVLSSLESGCPGSSPRVESHTDLCYQIEELDAEVLAACGLISLCFANKATSTLEKMSHVEGAIKKTNQSIQLNPSSYFARNIRILVHKILPTFLSNRGILQDDLAFLNSRLPEN